MKMAAIGLGKQKGAHQFHQATVRLGHAEALLTIAREVLRHQHHLPPNLEPGVVVPVVLGCDDAVAREHELPGRAAGVRERQGLDALHAAERLGRCLLDRRPDCRFVAHIELDRQCPAACLFHLGSHSVNGAR